MNIPTLFDPETEEHDPLPHKWEICGGCRGEGKSSAYLGAFTREDMEEEGPEFMEDYCSGFYDRACDECGGSGKVAVVDRARMTKDQRKAYDAQCREEAEYQAIAEAERRAGC